MSLLLNGDCNIELKEIDDESVDLIFCDLPYAVKGYSAVNCKWNTPVDLDLLWEHFMRIKKLHTPIFMTCNTRFGVDLIRSAPKKCPFRWDSVWVKSSSCSFLLARKMPMKKHEMLYCFYEHLPLYDLSSHTHKFLKNVDDVKRKGQVYDNISKKKMSPQGVYNPPLPVSVLKENIEEVIVDKPYVSYYIEDGDIPDSILEIRSTKGKHSTEKPVALISWILKYFSKEGDVVLDPTMGGGSCGVACREMNRNFIGIERDTEIYERAVDRIELNNSP